MPLYAAELGPSATLASDIIVTAQRRAENIKDVPISLSRFAEREIEDRHALRLFDLQEAVPNLLVDSGPFGNDSLYFEPGYRPPAGRYYGQFTAIDADWYHIAEDWN